MKRIIIRWTLAFIVIALVLFLQYLINFAPHASSVPTPTRTLAVAMKQGTPISSTELTSTVSQPSQVVVKVTSSPTPPPSLVVPPLPASNAGSRLLFDAVDPLATTASPALKMISVGDEGSDPDTLTTSLQAIGSAAQHPYDLRSSPNGQWVAVSMAGDMAASTQLFDVAAGELRPIGLEPGMHSIFLDWLSDGNTMLLLGNPTLDSLAALVDAQTGRTTRLDVPAYTYDVTLAPDGWRVLYTVSKGFGMGSEMWMMDRDGKNRRLVLQEPHQVILSPRWSPAGDALAYILRDDSDTQFVVGDLWLADGAGQHAQKVGQADAGHGYRLAWSPDGRWIAYVVRENAARGQANFDATALTSNIYLLDVQTKKVQPLTTFQDALTEQPVWSPDGKQIAFSTNASGTPDLWTVNVVSLQIQQITHGSGIQHLAWLPGKAQFADQATSIAATAAASITPRPTIVPSLTPTPMLGPIIQKQGTTAEGLTATFYQIPNASFTGAVIGRRAFFRDAQHRLIEADLSNPAAGGRIVGQNVNDSLRSVRVAADVHTLVYTIIPQAPSHSYTWPVMALNLDTGQTNSVGSTHGLYYPRLGVSDRGEILLLENGHLVLKNIDGTLSQPLTEVETRLGFKWDAIDFDPQNMRDPLDISLSPDGQKLAVFDGKQIWLANRDGQQVIEVPLNGDPRTMKPMGWPAVEFVAWSPDSQQLILVEGIGSNVPTFGGREFLRVIDVSTGKSFSLKPSAASPQDKPYRIAAWSANGARIAFLYPSSRLYIANADGSELHKLADYQGGNLTWSTDNNTLFYYCQRDTAGPYLCEITTP